METNEDITKPSGPSRRQKSWIATAAVATGLALGAAGLAGAATGSSGTAATNTGSSTAAATAAPAPPAGAKGTAPDPSTMKQGPGETLLTGDIAAKVEATALKAVPGATVIRVETDSSGGTYEAHMKKSDGSFVTVQFDADVNVTSTDSGFGRGPGPGPQGHAPPAGAPAAAPSDASGPN